MKREYRPSRTVARHDYRCSACGETIKKNSCVSKMFNYETHKECESFIIERYATAVARATEATHGIREPAHSGSSA